MLRSVAGDCSIPFSLVFYNSEVMENFSKAKRMRGYYTEDGVLFSKDGTCLLAFPPARTGNYKVPSHVTEIADGAFDRAGISVLDASDCSVLEIRSLPSYIELRR